MVSGELHSLKVLRSLVWDEGHSLLGARTLEAFLRPSTEELSATWATFKMETTKVFGGYIFRRNYHSMLGLCRKTSGVPLTQKVKAGKSAEAQ